MRYLLEIVDGPCKDKHFELPLNREIYFGSATPNTMALCKDTHLSAKHFSITCDGTDFHLRDLNSENGTFIHGINISDVVDSFALEDGYQFMAGKTTFRVHIEKPSVLGILRKQTEPLFAIVDSSRDESILPLLKASNNQYQSLFEGVRAEWLEEFAPYLVYLPKNSPLLEQLVEDGWDKNWAVYFTSRGSLERLVIHLRQFLHVKTHEGEKLYFRFYDPRILRMFLPTLTWNEKNNFFGPISCYLTEDETPQQVLEWPYKK